MRERSRSIFRTVKRQNPYVQIDRHIYEDARLSLKAMGLLGALLSKPNDWIINVNNLINHFKEGKAAIYSAINELIEYGYMVRIAHRDEKKQIIYYEYLVFESPSLNSSLQEPTPGEKFPNKQTSENESSKLVSENQKAGNQQPGNRPLLSNALRLKNDLTKDPPSYSPHKIDGGGSNLDLSILEPIALKLFNQSNDEILKKLKSKIKEFKLDPEVVKACLECINAKDIKSNPYSYFGFMYSVAIARVAKQKQVSEYQRQLQEQIKEQDSGAVEANGKSTAEIIADIKTKLGIPQHKETKDLAYEPN